MKKILILMMLCIFLLTGCIYQGEFRPEPDAGFIWVCEEPYAEFECFSKSMDSGKLIYDDVEYSIYYGDSPGSSIYIYSEEILQHPETLDTDEHAILYVKANYHSNGFTLTIIEDIKNIFDGKVTEMEFKKYTKEDYLKRIEAGKLTP